MNIKPWFSIAGLTAGLAIAITAPVYGAAAQSGPDEITAGLVSELSSLVKAAKEAQERVESYTAYRGAPSQAEEAAKDTKNVADAVTKIAGTVYCLAMKQEAMKQKQKSIVSELAIEELNNAIGQLNPAARRALRAVNVVRTAIAEYEKCLPVSAENVEKVTEREQAIGDATDQAADAAHNAVAAINKVVVKLHVAYQL